MPRPVGGCSDPATTGGELLLVLGVGVVRPSTSGGCPGGADVSGRTGGADAVTLGAGGFFDLAGDGCRAGVDDAAAGEDGGRAGDEAGRAVGDLRPDVPWMTMDPDADPVGPVAVTGCVVPGLLAW